MLERRLEEIWIYPLKGAAGISVPSWELDAVGLAHDRRWMLVDAEGHFRSQRSDPALCRVRPSIVDGALRLDTGELPTLALPLELEEGPPHRVRIWSDDVSARASPLGSEWFTAALGSPCTLVYLPEGAARACDPRIARGSRVGFADAFPLLLTSTESLAELNGRLEVPVPMDRFRPNFVVTAGTSYAEDEWTEIQIGGIGFRAVKPCVRCVVVTVDQQTGQGGTEPLRTLSSYRKTDGGVTFGQNLVHLDRGTIRAFSRVELLESEW